MRGEDWILILCFYFLYGSITGNCSCANYNRLSGDTATFYCDSFVPTGWSLNGNEVMQQVGKYEIDSLELTVRDITGTDEGNYSCIGSDGTTHEVACLIVYGAASFSDTSDSVSVSSDATVTFDLGLMFSGVGPSGHKQQVDHYCLRKLNGSCIVKCNGNGSACDIDDTDTDHWWTVSGGPVFVLHQAKSSDRGNYEAEVKLINPRQNAVQFKMKSLHVTSRECDEMYPAISDGTVSVLGPSPFINGAQANYSCNSGCYHQGPRSLRCLIRVIDNTFDNDWVNETGEVDRPYCFCPTSVMPPASTSSSDVSNKAVSPTTTVILNATNEVKTLQPAVIAAIVVPIIVIILVLLITLIVSLLLRRKLNHKPMEKPAKHYEIESGSDHDDDQSARKDDSPENRSRSSETFDYNETFSYNEAGIELDPDSNSMEGNI